MKTFLSLVVMSLVLISCGKNDPVYTGYYNTAPGPGNYGNLPNGVPNVPAPYQGNPTQCGSTGCFSNQMGIPGSYDNSFYTFMPIYQMVNGYSPTVWNQTWQYWQINAQMYGYQVNNIYAFLSFCGYFWSGTPYQNSLNYLNYYMYYWVTPQTAYRPYVNPTTFWSGYQNFPFYYCTQCH